MVGVGWNKVVGGWDKVVGGWDKVVGGWNKVGSIFINWRLLILVKFINSPNKSPPIIYCFTVYRQTGL